MKRYTVEVRRSTSPVFGPQEEVPKERTSGTGHSDLEETEMEERQSCGLPGSGICQYCNWGILDV